MSFISMVSYNNVLSKQQLKDARDWLIECYPDDEDEIDNTIDEDIERVINQTFDGGLNAFLKTYPENR